MTDSHLKTREMAKENHTLSTVSSDNFYPGCVCAERYS